MTHIPYTEVSQKSEKQKTHIIVENLWITYSKGYEHHEHTTCQHYERQLFVRYAYARVHVAAIALPATAKKRRDAVCLYHMCLFPQSKEHIQYTLIVK